MFGLDSLRPQSETCPHHLNGVSWRRGVKQIHPVHGVLGGKGKRQRDSVRDTNNEFASFPGLALCCQSNQAEENLWLIKKALTALAQQHQTLGYGVGRNTVRIRGWFGPSAVNQVFIGVKMHRAWQDFLQNHPVANRIPTENSLPIPKITQLNIRSDTET